MQSKPDDINDYNHAASLSGSCAYGSGLRTMLIQEFIPELAVKAFYKAILHRLA